MPKLISRNELLTCLIEKITVIKKDRPVRVAIDGARAAGKTNLADELNELLKSAGRQIIRVSADNFHNIKEIRYRKGRNSGEGYYRDAFDYQAIIDNVLRPLGTGGDLHYRRATLDFMSNAKVVSPVETAYKNAVLLMDGVFLFRPQMIHYWDLKIYIEVDFKIAVQRAIKRDGRYLGSELEIAKMYDERYIPGQNLYRNEVKPLERADIIINNNDFENPVIIKV